MNDGFPSRSYADVILSHGKVGETSGRFPVFLLASCRVRRQGEVRTRLTQGSRAWWTMTRVGQSNVVLGLHKGRPG